MPHLSRPPPARCSFLAGGGSDGRYDCRVLGATGAMKPHTGLGLNTTAAGAIEVRRVWILMPLAEDMDFVVHGGGVCSHLWGHETSSLTEAR